MSEKKGTRTLFPPEEKGYNYGTIIPMRYNPQTGDRDLAIPGLIRNIGNSMYDAFTLPGDVATGKRRATEADATNFAINTAGLGALSRVAPRAALAAEEKLLGQRMVNRVVPEPNPAAKTSILEGRALRSPEQVTHVMRNMSPAELESALKSGRFTVPKGGTKFATEKDPTKWWSAADAEGIFGRPWARTGSMTVRMPANKLPKGRAASIKDAEVFDSATKSWLPIREYGKKYAIGGVVIDDGNPAKQRKLI